MFLPVACVTNHVIIVCYVIMMSCFIMHESNKWLLIHSSSRGIATANVLNV